MVPLNGVQQERYRRQIMLDGMGTSGQEKLLQGRVLVIGVGGLGSPAAFYLAAAGVGTIGLLDDDTVALSNLQRQILHGSPDLGRPKVDSGQDRLLALNPDLDVRSHRVRLDAQNAAPLVAGYDFVLDCSDNFETKFLINDACVQEQTPFSHAGIRDYQGQTMTVIPGRSACYRCVFQAPPPPTENELAGGEGVLGAVAGVLGALQAAEAIKYLTGVGTLLTDRLLVCDCAGMRFRESRFRRRPDCGACAGITDISSQTFFR